MLPSNSTYKTTRDIYVPRCPLQHFRGSELTGSQLNIEYIHPVDHCVVLIKHERGRKKGSCPPPHTHKNQYESIFISQQKFLDMPMCV